MNKRGQLSLEFLMAYGWVIFVVLGLIAAFSFVGVLYPEKVISERFVLTPPFYGEAISFTASTGDIVLRIRNGFHKDIDINEIATSENLRADPFECWTIIMPPGGERIKSDSSKEFVIDCNFVKGQAIRGEVEITYAEAGAPLGLIKVAKGDILGQVSG